MYKKIRAFLSTILVLFLMIASSTTAFATESANTEYPEGVPEYAEMHEVVIEIPADDYSALRYTEKDPYKSKEYRAITSPGATTGLTSISSTERKIRFEFYVTVDSGFGPSGSFSVNILKSGSSVESITGSLYNHTYHSGIYSTDGYTFVPKFTNGTNATLTLWS